MSRTNKAAERSEYGTQRCRTRDLETIQRIARALDRDGVRVVAAAVHVYAKLSPSEQLDALHEMERASLETAAA